MNHTKESNCQPCLSGENIQEASGASSVVEALCDGGTYKVKNPRLKDIRVCYRRGDSTIIFDPPKEHTYVLLMEHIVNDRKLAENNLFRLEKGFDKSCLVYYVENYIYHSKDWYDPDNKVVLSCQVNKRKIRREIMFMYFFCGAYCTRELTQDEQDIVRKYRELVNETYDIFRN